MLKSNKNNKNNKKTPNCAVCKWKADLIIKNYDSKLLYACCSAMGNIMCSQAYNTKECKDLFE
jgi:hypothetical protein